METRLCFGMSSAVSWNVSEVAKWTHATPDTRSVYVPRFSREFKAGAFVYVHFFPVTRKEIPYGIARLCFN